MSASWRATPAFRLPPAKDPATRNRQSTIGDRICQEHRGGRGVLIRRDGSGRTSTPPAATGRPIERRKKRDSGLSGHGVEGAESGPAAPTYS